MAEDLIQVAEEIQSTTEIKEIPIDKPLQDFHHHLSYNERIIFSAKFGDGKTYFLNKFFEVHKDEFEAIRIFPVNYQVADNKDVFELIKKDILIHLLANDLIEDEDFFDESIYAQNYLFNNGADIVFDILSDVPAVKVPAKIIQKSLKHLKKYKNGKVDSAESKRVQIENYLLKFEEDKGVAEYDVISELITRIIKSIQDKGKKKKVVLIIDDLDRIDPAHLFRILNVLTAHIDRDIILQKEIEDGVGNNKFNFDHIITVFDIENAKNIFSHLYGLKTDFPGYISKFISGKPFEYSLQNILMDYVFENLSERYGIDKNILKITKIREAIRKASVRDKIKLISGIEKEIVNCIIEEKETKFSSVNKFTCFLVLLKRLDLRIIDVFDDLLKVNKFCLFNLIGVNLYLGSDIVIGNDVIGIAVRLGSNNSNWSKITIKRHNSIVEDIEFLEDVGDIDISVLRSEVKLITNKLIAYVKL
ncbi:hypothetical protein DWB61_04275 [Ancylomarina euxinus]|uniref:KAP NTPase domain-containing protein n=1 Tax=Ancylomarina euxinus TaxID=2283627 RepID=A0A425Y543_9BACT|nr:P-loop NTPase fold protein [Ancylomarina euxinus]MCZ4694370.1 P-loop NTPase fold protein [Ancylomarina euxinus]MUP14299.1 hypothetical protein [Ancylomarina euxinus]RRG23616.1 hypothetical protein DWB61_04275 [Ancylomarina euxinus]